MISKKTAHGEKTFLAFQDGSKINIEHLGYYTGGGATNSAISFARLGFDVHCCIKIGNDPQGTSILQELSASHIKTIHSYGEKRTGCSFIIPTASKDRVVLAWRGANTELTFNDIDQQALQKSNVVYITSLSGASSSSLLPIAQYAKRHNIIVATNPGTSQLTVGAHTLVQALSYIDILILNSYEATLCMQSLINQNMINLNNAAKNKLCLNSTQPTLFSHFMTYKNKTFYLKQFMDIIQSCGPRLIVVTNGAEGVYIATEGKILFHQSLSTNICNTLGAGDGFGSCFTAHILQEYSIKEAIFKGLLNAQSVIKQLDAKSGLLTTRQLAKQYAMHIQSQHFYSCT